MAGLATALAVAAAGVGGAHADSAVNELTARQLAGQRVVAGFSGPQPPRELRRRIRRGHVGGVILFGQNVRSKRQVRRVVRRLERVRRPAGLRAPLFVMVDQEGGPVLRIPGGPHRSAAEIGATGKRRAARHAGRVAGRNLHAAGANVNLAPVADVARPDSAMERERRTYGRRPGKVARFASAFAAGVRAEGVLPSAKHFPGFGAASANTDNRPVTIRTGRKKLRRVDYRPYRALFARGLRLVMLSTAIYRALDRGTPAAFSYRVATRELRGHLGFRGVSMTDAIGTPATAPFGSPPRAGVRAARAGVDLMLFVSYETGKAGTRTLARAIRTGRLKRSRAERSVQRILRVRRSIG
ncbi:MAG TPA: glycoside hydrolase family 3 N-terminal domain-containing protein [Thermoleophilaceae bacterium]|nr:glycoside hydrolase family 3 N-terminal domain-containing protein [Thermoleophilaceae bacterium]